MNKGLFVLLCFIFMEPDRLILIFVCKHKGSRRLGQGGHEEAGWQTCHSRSGFVFKT